MTNLGGISPNQPSPNVNTATCHHHNQSPALTIRSLLNELSTLDKGGLNHGQLNSAGAGIRNELRSLERNLPQPLSQQLQGDLTAVQTDLKPIISGLRQGELPSSSELAAATKALQTLKADIEHF